MKPVTTRQPLRVHVRGLRPEDYEQILAIDKASSGNYESVESMVAVFCPPNHFGYVAEYGGRILGFATCHIGKVQIHVVDLAVLPASRRRGVGTQLVAKLAGRLFEDSGRRLVIEVRESNRAAHLFLRTQGFWATQVIRDHFEGDGEDAYRFVYPSRDECRG